MIAKSVAIARHTYLELVRQPASCFVTLLTLVAYAFGPRLAMFALDEESRLLAEFGASTILLAGWILVSLGASNVVRREIESRTTLTLLAKPVSREVFLLGKFLGVAAFLAVPTYLFTLALLFAHRQGPLIQRVPVDWPVLIGGGGGLGAAIVLATLRWARRERSFSASVLGFSVAGLSAGFLLAGFLGPQGSPQPFGRGFDLVIPGAALLAFLALAVLGAFAVSVSVWTGRGGTLVLTAVVFVLGLRVGELPETWRRLLFFLPDFRLFWAGELFYRDAAGLPLAYLLLAALEALAYVTGFLALGMWALSRRGL